MKLPNKTDGFYKERYLEQLAKEYPSRTAAECEIIRLNAILELPKGTEHFISDIHAEADALSHLMRNASGVIKRKLRVLFGKDLSEEKLSELATLIYYPEQKLKELAERGASLEDILPRLIALCRLSGAKYTRAKVRDRIKRAAGEFHEIITELVNMSSEQEKADYYAKIYSSLLRSDIAARFICALCSAIRSLVVDKLHVVGDIFDRGARADLVMDELMKQGEIDFQWGNHDALWMGAAAGSEACCAAAVANSLAYGNTDFLEIGYGITLRALSEFAASAYEGTNLSRFMPRCSSALSRKKANQIAAMYKAISVIRFKLEGKLIERNPDFRMDDRRLLHKIDRKNRKIEIGKNIYELADSYFPTMSNRDPYELMTEEAEVIASLVAAFTHSARLKMHVEFLYKHGSTYKCENGNLLFHGCIPLDDEYEFLRLPAAADAYGKGLMDYCDRLAREGYFAKVGSPEKKRGQDFLWFLWHGKNSPLAARTKMTSFERLFVKDKEAKKEPRNPYYKAWEDRNISRKILEEFGLDGEQAHIINGHIPIKKGENPIKDGGRLIVIDGGFCSAYHGRTGIGGYTLIYNADGMMLSAHEPFSGKENAIKRNADIISVRSVFERSDSKIKIKQTDKGQRLLEKIEHLRELIEAYDRGKIK